MAQRLLHLVDVDEDGTLSCDRGDWSWTFGITEDAWRRARAHERFENEPAHRVPAADAATEPTPGGWTGD